MKVLQLCSKPPLPKVDGGCIAMHNFSQHYINIGAQLKVLTISTDKHPFVEEAYPIDYRKKIDIEAFYTDTRVNLVDAFATLITQDSYNVSRFFSVDFDLKLKSILQRKKVDFIQVESLFMTPYLPTIRRFSKAKILLRSHNLEYLIWERLAKQEKLPPKKMYLNYLANQLKKYEVDIMNQVDGIIAISSTDHKKYERLGCNIPLITLPLGIKLSDYEYSYNPSPNVFHIGAMDWTPNQEAMEWFLDKVWPIVLKEVPDAQLNLAGREMVKKEYHNPSANVAAIGEVPSARAFMAENQIMIVPLLSGGGIRIKIVEGLAMGKTIVSTSIGAEGIPVKNGKHILLGDTPEDFAMQIIKAHKDEKLRESISKNGRAFAESHYANKVIETQLQDYLKRLST